MNELNTKTLYSKYPNLYAAKDEDMTKTAMCWGFACGDGWFKLIDNLSSQLEKIIVKYKREHKDFEGFKAAQVKEKYGTLRFYMHSVPSDVYDEVNEAINKAEEKSCVTCEKCGAPGKLRKGGWLSTLCDAHSDGREVFSWPDAD